MNSDKKLITSCGGKVFLLGEYACLIGYEAIVATNKPRFELVSQRGRGKPLPFAAESPAGLLFSSLLKQYPNLSEIEFEWKDPYLVPIGVGSSSAQFLLLFLSCCQWLDQPKPSARSVLNLYWDTVGTSQGIRPSGLDVLSQMLGSIHLFSNEPYKAKKLKFSEKFSKSFLLAFTGSKAKTHEHLLKLSKNGWPNNYDDTIRKLSQITKNGHFALIRSDAELFGKAMNEYQKELGAAKIAEETSIQLFEEIQKWDGVFGAKGSGAQGGDCILFCIDQAKKKSVEEKISSKKWTIFELEIDSESMELSWTSPS